MACRHAAWAIAFLIQLAGCRGDAPRAGAAAPPPDEPLGWPALDNTGLVGLLATDEYRRGAPELVAITPDGAVVFRRSPPRDATADLYQLDATGNTTLVAATAALLGRPARAGETIAAITMSSDGARLVIPLAGRVFVVERATAAARELAIGAHRDPQLSPDGRRIAFVRDGDLWVASIAPPVAPVRLTRHPADREYATPEAVAARLGRQAGYWWAPDGQSIAFQRTDATAVDPADRKQPRSGAANARVDLGIVSVRGGPPRWVSWDLARYPYLARVVWPARGALTLVVANRAQTELGVLAVDPATGATRPLVVDRDPAWENLAADPVIWLPDGAGLLWMTERRGAWSLERYAADGTPRGEVVTPDLGLRRVVGLSGDGREVIIEATIDPRALHVWRVPLDGGVPVALDSSAGVSHAVTGHGVTVVDTASSAGARLTTVVRAGGTRAALASSAERPRQAATTRIETLTLDDHLQYAAVTRPHNLAPNVRYPVILRIDGEPSRNAVVDANDSYLLDQWYADAGFIVVRTDGRGTPGRDRLWQRAIAGDVLTIPMNDQIAALKQLGARHPELDLRRVGALGADHGGYLAAMAVLLHPDVFAAAVAMSPITDWGLVDTVYAERFLRTPAANPEGYRRAAAASYAEQLARPLLVMPGPGDGLAHSLSLIEALSAAGKRVEIATLPRSPDLAGELATQKLVLGFLRDHLGPPVRPGVMPAPRSEEEEEEREQKRR